MDSQNSKDLEKKVWYRTAKVFYGIGWVFVILVALLTIYVLQPNTYTDMDKSYFTCPDGTKYNTKGMTLDFLKEETLSLNDDQKARTACYRSVEPSQEQSGGYTKEQLIKAAEWDLMYNDGKQYDEIKKLYNLHFGAGLEGKDDLSKTYSGESIYKLTLVESTNGSWENAIIWAIIIAIIGFGVLEIIRKITMYILVGNSR